VSTRSRDITDGKPADATRQMEQVKAFRDTWEYGIHSYLAYLRDRLVVARELLHESGSVFVQIGEENVHLVRSVLDEVFGPHNFVSLITYSKTSGATADLLPGTADYIVWYAKNREVVKYRRIFATKAIGGAGAGKYDQVELADGSRRAMTQSEKALGSELPPGARAYRLDNLTSQSVGRGAGRPCPRPHWDSEPFLTGTVAHRFLVAPGCSQ
jgi:adenine-specific DNA-methyltransferase